MTRSVPIDPSTGVARAAFLSAFAFALLASGSLVCQRLAGGHFAFGWLCSAAVTAGSVILLVSARVLVQSRSVRHPSRSSIVFCSQFCGIATAIVFVHLGLSLLASGQSLVEAPAQLVNDAALDLTMLGFVWSLASRDMVLRVLLPFAAWTLLVGYALTMRHWHLDPFRGFEVQRYVIGQVFATSVSLLLYRALS